MNKICTDINQSKKLIELGIDINTADMLWTYDFMVNDINGVNVISEQLKPEENDIPAWSFTALFNMLPKSARLEKGSSSELCQINLPIELKCSDWYLNPIDAVFEIICVLKKEEYIIMNKICTSIEQSKKLAEILPIESADMYYYKDAVTKEDNPRVMDYSQVPKNKSMYYTPCWSLAALLEVLPLGIYDELDDNDYELEINMIDKMPRYIRLGDIYHSQFPYDFEKDTLLDNIVESIIWLNDNNYFEL